MTDENGHTNPHETPVDRIPDGELGVALDATIEKAIQCRSAAELLSEYQVELDAMADSHDIPPQLASELRDVQARTAELADSFDQEAENTSNRLKTIRERLY